MLSTGKLGGWIIFNPALVKNAVAVIQPNIETLMSDRVLDDEVSRAIVIDVQSPDRQLWFGRFKREFSVIGSGKMELNPKAALAQHAASFQKNCGIQLVVVIEVCDGESLHERRREAR